MKNNVVIGVNEKFKKSAYVMLYSLLRNNKKLDFEIHIISDYLELSYFKELENDYNCKLHLYKIDTNDISKLNFRHIDTSTFYRLKMDEYLPRDIDKLLYLDSDIIVDGSIDDLLDTEFNDNELVAAVECKISTKHLESINFRGNYYFNAGVIYFDYQKCLRMNIFKKALEELKRSEDKYIFMDQDVLNIVLKNNVKFISPKWNYSTFFAVSELLGKNEIDTEPKIIHYTGIYKPWNYVNINKYSYKYLNYYKELFDEEVKVNDKTLLNKLKKIFKLSLYKFYLSRKLIFLIRNKYRK